MYVENILFIYLCVVWLFKDLYCFRLGVYFCHLNILTCSAAILCQMWFGGNGFYRVHARKQLDRATTSLKAFILHSWIKVTDFFILFWILFWFFQCYLLWILKKREFFYLYTINFKLKGTWFIHRLSPFLASII